MKQRGFTLIELLVVMVILSILLVIVGQFIASQTTILRKQQVIANTQQNVRVAGEIITRDIEMACLNPTRIPDTTFTFVSYPRIISRAGGKIAFWMDLNGDGYRTMQLDSLPRRDEYRGFYIQGGPALGPDTLKRDRRNNLNEDIAVGIDSVTFVYYDKNWAVVPPGATPDSGKIARVDFSLFGRSTRPYRGNLYIVRRAASKVVVRNRAA